MAEMLFAANEGDVSALLSQKNAGLDFSMDGINFSSGDYDSRTALHLAAAGGHPECVKFLIESIPSDKLSDVINAKDRWGGTPLDDAIRQQNYDCEELLREAGGKTGTSSASESNTSFEVGGSDSAKAIWAASRGDLNQLVSLRVAGVDLNLADYDGRTAAHLAASNGHDDVLRYINSQHGLSSVLEPKDRFGFTPLDDSAREGQERCKRFLESLIRKS
jgi:glutaminase